MLATLTREIVHLHRVENERDVSHDVYEGEVRMSQEQQDHYQQLIGDAQASITVSRELSEADYGNGGKIFVSVTLRCHQSEAYINAAVAYASKMAEDKVWEYHAALRNQLLVKGIIKPRP